MDKNKLLATASYFAAFAAMGISMASLGPTLPGLMVNTGSDLSTISILFTARSLGSLIGSVGIGQIYDRVRGHTIFAFMVLGIAILTALTPFISILWMLTAVLFFTGVFQGILNIGGNAMLVWQHGRDVAPYMNGMHLFFGIGTFITPVIVAQFILQEGGLGLTYLLMAVLILPSAAAAFLPSPASPASHRNGNGDKPRPLLIVLIALVFGCYSGASLAYGGWIFTYAIQMNMANETTAAYLTSIYWGALTIGRLIAIPLAARYQPQHILWADYSGALLSLIILLLWPRSQAAVIAASAGLGFALASIYPTTMSMAGQVMTISGKITGLLTIGSNAGAMLIPWMIGQFFETAGPTSMTYILLFDMVLGLAVLWLLDRWNAAHSAIPISQNP